MLDLVGLEWAAEDIVFAIGEPLFQNLVTAELVGPDGRRHVAPVGTVVQVHIESSIAESRKIVFNDGTFGRCVCPLFGASLAGHYGFSVAMVAPTCGDGEVITCHVAMVDSVRDGDHGQLGAQRAGCHARN